MDTIRREFYGKNIKVEVSYPAEDAKILLITISTKTKTNNYRMVESVCIHKGFLSDYEKMSIDEIINTKLENIKSYYHEKEIKEQQIIS